MMYLINVRAILDIEEEKVPREEVLKHFYETDLDGIQYAILSHCWCAVEEGELLFDEVRDLSIDAADKLQGRGGYQKVVGGCNKARADEIEWLWAAPCCISWENDTDLSEAVNAMYRWYANSKRCYAYLHDVDAYSSPTKTGLNNSKWFSCCWTLQGLIASRDIEFFDYHWTKIGNKANMVFALKDITRVSLDVLNDGLPPPHHPRRPSVAQIMSWAASRQTRRVEDQAYSLVGLFGVYMEIRYGEKENAFQRLQEAIIEEYNDHTIFAWFNNLRTGSLLADNPDCFLGSFNVVRLDPPVAFAPECPSTDIDCLKDHRRVRVTKRGIEIWLPVADERQDGNHAQATLACCRIGNPNLVSINLSAALCDYDDLFIRDMESGILSLSKEPVFRRVHFVYRQSRLIHQAFVGHTRRDKTFIEQHVSRLDSSLGNASDIVPLLLHKISQWTTNMDGWVDIREKSSLKQVSRGLLPSSGTLVAVKVPRVPPPAWNKEDMERQLHELCIWSMLDHQNIHSLLGIITTFTFPISIVSKWAEKNALDYVQDPDIDPRPLCQSVACALAYLHNHKWGVICHGNVKGKNVLITEDGRSLLANFGYSSFVSESSTSLVPRREPQPSETGDMWDFGMTIVELFTRQASPSHYQRTSTLSRGVQVIPDRPSNKETRFRMTDQWWGICSSCWNSDPLLPSMRHIVEKITEIMCFLPASPRIDNLRSAFSSNLNRDSILGELQCVVDLRFGSIDLGDRVSRGCSPIGFGSCAVVYQGTLDGQMKVAVKVVRGGDRSSLPVLKGLLREVYIWSKLRHENIITLLGMTTAFDDTISIVAPLMSMGDAFGYVQNPDVDPRPLILGIANGLHYLHTYEQGPVIHGDIKGTNVLVSNDGHALLTDFGFSHLAEASFSLAVEQRPGGTLNWMAPEYLEGNEFTRTTAGDVWAFGMTALELFTRKRPFGHWKNTRVIIRHILFEERERPSADASCYRLMDEWWNICLLCWTRDPSLRPQTSHIVRVIRTLVQTKSEVDAHSLPRKVLTDSNNSSDQSDPRKILKEVAERASRYSTNLDHCVVKDRALNTIRGGSAVVFLGTIDLGKMVDEVATIGGRSWASKHGNRVAIKTPRPPGFDEINIKKFLKEVHVWSKLDHANVLPLLGITTQFDLTVSMVSPWMDNGNARDYVQDKAVDPRPLIHGIAKGLHYLHNHEPYPIFYGDLKGVNVLISDNGEALLNDFGLSVAVNSSFSMTMSSTGGIVGTFRWMSPEMLDGCGVSPEADVWAFGMTALELFTRKDPFHLITTLATIISRIANHHGPDRPSTDDTFARMTDEWWDLCTNCWEYDPVSRPTISCIIQTITKIMNMSQASIPHGVKR